MRITQLATVALQAEKLRLQRKLRALALRLALALVALVFLGLGLTFLHLAGYAALCQWLAPWWAALCLAGVDFLLMLVLLLVALRSGTDTVQSDAVAVRDDAFRQIRNTLAFAAAARPLARALGRKGTIWLGFATFLGQMFARHQR